MDQTYTGDAIEQIADLARKSIASVTFLPLPEGILPGDLIGRPAVAIVESPDGAPRIEPLDRFIDPYRAKPLFREGTASTGTLDSFVALVTRHASADTAIFVDANWRAPKLTAVVDYHAAAPQVETVESADGSAVPVAIRAGAPLGEDALARFGRHRVVYPFPLSEPWKLWLAMDGKPMTQTDFAAFVEDHIQDIASPDQPERVEWETRFRTKFADPNALVDLARGLEVNVDAKVKTKTRLQSGEMSLVFETEHRNADGTEVTVPGLFLLSIPVFYGGEEARIPVRLRYRVAGNSLAWFYQIYRPDLMVDERVQADVSSVRHETGLPVYVGAPEIPAR